MKCSNHPNAEAADRCDGCAEPYCTACLVEVQGQNLCDSCKVMVVKNRKIRPRPLKTGRLCDDARNALICSILGLTCCCLGIIMHPIALFLAHQAVGKIQRSENLTGIEVARAAQVTSAIGLVVSVLSIIFNLATSTAQ